MKKKTIWSLVLTLALAVSAIGATAVAFAATPDTAEPAAAITTENEDAIWEQIEAVEAKSDAVFQRNAALWEKLDEACNALPEDYNFEGFDEAEFIRGMTTLTEAEKETLLADIKELNEIDTLEQEYDRISEKNADLWDKVDEAYFGLPDDYDFDNYDEISFIRSLNVLTDAEKEALVTDYNRLVEIDNRLCELNNSVWGNTGCESGICPL